MKYPDSKGGWLGDDIFAKMQKCTREDAAEGQGLPSFHKSEEELPEN